MKLVIAGSRSIPSYRIINYIMNKNKSLIIPKIILSGTADGADEFGEMWAENNKIPVKRFKPNWNQYGKSAGFLRNIAMEKEADMLLFLWDGKSKGTKHIMQLFKNSYKPIIGYKINIFPDISFLKNVKNIYLKKKKINGKII